VKSTSQLGPRSLGTALRPGATIALAICALALPYPSQCAAQTASVEPPPSPAIVAASIPGGANSIVRVAAGADAIHIVVGHSLFLNSRSRLKRVYVADPAVLNSITLTPNQIIVTAMTPGVSSLILLDEVGQAQSYVVSSDLDVQGLRTAIAKATGQDATNTVSVEGSGDRVLLSGKVGSEAIAASAVKLATLYSKDVANSLIIAPGHPKQVRLKVRILEVDRSKLTQLGINLFNPGGNTSFLASTTTSQFPSNSTLSSGSGGNTSFGTLTTSNPLNFLLYSSKLNLGATVQDLETKNVLQILAEPTITTISGQKADFLSGGEFPFPVIQPGGGSGTSASVTIQFRPYGVKLEFTPIVNDDGTIRLKVAPEVSALDYTNAVTISGYTIPALSTRKAETEVELRSDQSFAISGLLDQRTTDLLSKTPGAASIPIIGALFKSKNITHSTTELVVIITPTLVDPLLETDQPVQPDLPIQTLNKNTFDNSLGKNHNPNPAAPPVNPSPSVNRSEPPSAPSSPAANPTGAAQDSIPETPHRDIPPVTTPSTPTSIPGSTVSSVDPPQPLATVVDPPPSTTLGHSAPPESVPSKSAPPASAPPESAPSLDRTALVSAEIPQRYVFDSPTAATAIAPVPAQPAAPAASAPAMVQIMALSHKEDADAMVIALRRHGYDVAITQDTKDSRLHLEVGPFKDKSDAEAMRHKLLEDGYNATVK
jgi:pilus assembly protein CpaC